MRTLATCLLLSALASAQTQREPDLAALRATILEILERENAPGVSAAFIEDFDVRWAGGFGVLRRGAQTAVDERTLFQAASISKPVAAAAALSMVEEGLLDLDEPVNVTLKSWQLPGDGAERVTLRHLLSHMAGLTVHGFPGYSPAAKIPGVVAILDGREPANTAAVRIDLEPGTEWRYSGGGITVAQLLMVEVAGRPFPAIMKERVLDPAGMVDSTYEQPLPERLRSNAARAHEGGDPGDDPWHVYPEMAAAGLWTTPSDLARFLIAVRNASIGDGKLLSQQTARDMISPQLGGPWGIGIQLSGTGSDPVIGHGGSNWGFRCNAELSLNRGTGVVVMTNCGNGRVLQRVGQAVRQTFTDGRPVALEAVVERTEVEVAPDILRTYTGEYEMAPELFLVLTLEGGSLFVQPTGQRKLPLFAESETGFFLKAVEVQISITKDESGAVTGLVLRQGGRERTGRKVK